LRIKEQETHLILPEHDDDDDDDDDVISVTMVEIQSNPDIGSSSFGTH
jgi:hypothetical protein